MNDKLSAQEVLETKGVFVTTTVGVSMLPLFKNRRDRVVIRPIENRLKKYDVALYRRKDELVLHRVIGVNDGHYIIRGDNSFSKEIVYDEQVLGVLSEFYRKDKHFSVDDKAYLAYSRLWNFIYPIRYLYVLLKSAAIKILK